MAKLIYLAGPTTIGDRIVTPIEGPQIVSDEQAIDLKGHDLLARDAEDAPLGVVPPVRSEAPHSRPVVDVAARRQASERQR